LPHRKSRILCFGGLHYDDIIRCEADTILNESNPASRTQAPGGVALNVARTLAALGNTVGLSSRVGADREGVELLDYVTQLGITAVSIQTDNAHATARYTAVLDHTSNLILGLADMGIYDDFKPIHWQQDRQEIKHWNYWCVDTNLPADTLHYLASEKAERLLFAVVTSPAKAHRLRGVLPTVDTIFVNRVEPILWSTQIRVHRKPLKKKPVLYAIWVPYERLSLQVSTVLPGPVQTASATLLVQQSIHSQSQGQAMYSLAPRWRRCCLETPWSKH